MKTKFYIAAVSVALLAGCSSSKPAPMPSPAVILDTEVRQMGRTEVIEAVHECESAGLVARMVRTKRRIGQSVSDVTVDVECAPKWRYQ